MVSWFALLCLLPVFFFLLMTSIVWCLLYSCSDLFRNIYLQRQSDLFVVSLQFRVFNSGQAFGQGVSGSLYPDCHRLRRTPRWSKKLGYAAPILTVSPYLSCFTAVEQNQIKQLLEANCCERHLLYYVERGSLKAVLEILKYFGNNLWKW